MRTGAQNRIRVRPSQLFFSVEYAGCWFIVTPTGQRLALGDIANISIEDGPATIKSENSRINGWVLIDIENTDVGSYVDRAMATVGEELELPPGYSISWSGQYEYMLRAKEKLTYLVPFTLLIIALLLFLNFQRFAEIAVLLCTLPLALVGSVWLIYWQDYHFSIAVGVGFIALAGVAVETSVIMLVYLNQSWQQASDTRQGLTDDELKDSIVAGAGLRVRPVLMTACATIAGLIPILMGSGTGSEVMSRLATPMVGGMISAVLSTLLILPAVYYLWRR